TLPWGCLLAIFLSGVPQGQCLACGKSAARRLFAQDGELEPFKRRLSIVSLIFAHYTRLWIGVTIFLPKKKSRSLMHGNIARRNHRVQVAGRKDKLIQAPRRSVLSKIDACP